MARRGTIAMLVAGAACLLAAAVGAYAGYAILDERRFADRAVRALGSDDVRSEVSVRLVDRAIAGRRDLTAARATLQGAALAGVVRDREFTSAFRVAAARMHHAIFSDADGPAALVVPGSGAALRADLTQRLPVPDRRAPRFADPQLLEMRSSGLEGTLRAIAPPARALVGPLTAGLAVLALAFLVTGVARARDRRLALSAAALAVAAAGGVTAAGVTGAHEMVVGQFTGAYGDAVVTAIWDAFLADLRRWALLAAAAGLVVAAAVYAWAGARPSRMPSCWNIASGLQ
jgi:hypothetical protein